MCSLPTVLSLSHEKKPATLTRESSLSNLLMAFFFPLADCNQWGKNGRNENFPLSLKPRAELFYYIEI